MSRKKRMKAKLRGKPAKTPAIQAPAPIDRGRIDELAYELFLKEGGGELELMIQTGQLTVEAFDSQMRASRDGGEGWGPTVTPYEDRMNRSLQLRLIKEKRQWLKDCRQRIEQKLEQQAESEAEPAQAEPQPRPEPVLAGTGMQATPGAAMPAEGAGTPPSVT